MTPIQTDLQVQTDVAFIKIYAKASNFSQMIFADLYQSDQRATNKNTGVWAFGNWKGRGDREVWGMQWWHDRTDEAGHPGAHCLSRQTMSTSATQRFRMLETGCRPSNSSVRRRSRRECSTVPTLHYFAKVPTVRRSSDKDTVHHDHTKLLTRNVAVIPQ